MDTRYNYSLSAYINEFIQNSKETVDERPLYSEFIVYYTCIGFIGDLWNIYSELLITCC